MQVIIKKGQDNFYHLTIINIMGRLLYAYSSKILTDVIEALYKLIDSKIIFIKSKSIHFIDFINPILVSSKLKVYNHKVKAFNKAYTNNRTYTNKMDMRIIAQESLKSFKMSKDIEAYYHYLKYSDVYKDFSKVV